MSLETQMKKPRRSTSLATALTTAFVLITLLALFAVGSYQVYYDFRTQQALVLSNQRLEASRAANEVASFIREIFNTLDAAARVGQLDIVATEERRLWLDNLLGVHPALRTLSFVDETGQELAKVAPSRLVSPSELTSYAGTDLLTQVLQEQRYVSSIFRDQTTQEPLVILAIPVNNVSGEFEGALVAEVNLELMWNLVNELEVGETGLAYVVNRRGELVALRNDPDRALRRENVSHLAEVSEFLNDEDEVSEKEPELMTGINGDQVLSTFVPLGFPDWAVMIEQPVGEAYQDVIQSIAISVGILLFVAVAAGVAGLYASRRLAAPLLNLTSTATRIAGGELDLEVQPAGPTEIVRLANAFNSMTHQLRELIDSLEQRIAARTQRLATVATLSERLVAILDLDELLAEMVNQIKETFGYYHAHVFLLDEQERNLVVVQGAGPAGAEMKARGHSISLDAPTSLVARAARNSEIVRVDNVREAEDWLPNPLLPDTYAEMAVPIILEGEVVGVLDVQQNKIASLDEGDANLLRSLVNQVAIAMHNARLFDQVEKALADAYVAQERYIEQSWDKAKIKTQGGQYLYLDSKVAPLDEAKQKMIAKVREQISSQASAQTLVDNDDKTASHALAAPVRIGNTLIGALQLHRTDPNQSWNEDDKAIIEAVTEQLAQTAENLRLFEETRSRASQEKIIREITERMRASTSLAELVKVTAQELGSRLLAEHAIVEIEIETEQIVVNDRTKRLAHAHQNGN